MNAAGEIKLKLNVVVRILNTYISIFSLNFIEKYSNLELVKQKGLDAVTVDDLVAELVPRGRALVPDQVKKELLQRIRGFLLFHLFLVMLIGLLEAAEIG